MRRAWAQALSALVLATALALDGGAAEALAEQETLNPELMSVRLSHDQQGWFAGDRFVVEWEFTPHRRGPRQPTSIGYRLEDDAGRTVLSGEAAFPASSAAIAMPAAPGPASGVYRLLAWTQDAGLTSAPQETVVRIDNSRPSAVTPIVPSGWIRAGESVSVRIEHPSAPLPLSGIRGYAVALDLGSSSGPCAGEQSCTTAETDLTGGLADDSIVLGPVAEQANVVRVVAVSGTGMRSRSVGTAALHVDGTPPRIAIAAPAGWSTHAVRATATAVDPLSGMAESGPSGPFTAIAADGGTPNIAPGPQAAITVHGDGRHAIVAFGRDAVGNAGSPEAAEEASVWIDETEPRAAFAASQDPADPEQIVATIADSTSGPSPDAGSIGVRPAGSSVPFTPLPTAISGIRLLAHWDSDAYPAGAYEFRATAYDVAGNRGETRRRSDGSPMVLSNPVKTATSLVLAFGGHSFVSHVCRRGPSGLRCRNRSIVPLAKRPTDATVGYGRGIPVSGRLTTASGSPLAGQRVEVIESFAAGSEPSGRTTTVETGGDGFFLARLAPGPDREVSVAFAGTRTLAASRGGNLRLGVGADVRLRTSTATARVGGAPVVFSGHVGGRGAQVPAAGLPIALEFRVAGLPWTEFRTLQTDRTGAFRFPYAFSDDDSRGIRFQFRAHLASQPGWPYDEAYSRPVAVTGR